MRVTRPRAAAELLAVLIADIRGYTAFTQSRGDEAGARLAARFAGIAREGIEAHGGRLLELRGDEALAVFGSARDSLRACAALQLVFADETELHPELPLNVGIGVDAGEVVPVEGGYRGGALNLAARLCSVAGAGESLASEGVIHLARAVEGVRITEWGTTEVKGLSTPVRAYDVRADGPERSGGWAAGVAEVPAELDVVTPLVGREHELASACWAWRIARRGAGRPIVVRGVAGIGKTRLLAALAEVAVAGGGRCMYVSLAEDPNRSLDVFVAAAKASTEPSLIVIDDGDAAGSEQLKQIDGLVRDITGRPALLALALDDESASESSLRVVRHWAARVEIAPPPLDLEQMRAIAALYLASAAAEVPHDVLAATGGVPRAVHLAVTEWIDHAATRRLGSLASQAASGRSDLRYLEADLAGSVVDLQQVRERVRLYGLGPGRHASEPAEPPYRGLASFDVADADLYFGRERLVADALARLAGANVLGIVGASGSGKSSLVRAGVVPALHAGVLPGSEHWVTVVLRPGERPMRALDRAVLPALPDGVAERLTGSIGVLAQVAALVPAERRIVLVIDQCEEVFTLCPDDTERAEFLAAIAEVPPGAGVLVIVVVRADFYGRFAAVPELATQLSANHLLVGAMSADEYRRAIVNPALRVGASVEPELVDRLVDDILGEPGALPLLSTSLFELWRHRAGRTLRAATYAETGGVHGAVARLAEDAYAGFTDEEQTAARRMLLRLAGPGEGDLVVRRRVPLSDFDLASDETTSVVLDQLIARRLLTVSEGYVEVAHEALLREWPRFRTWLDEDREGIRLRAHLAAATQAWITAARDPGELYRGARLSAALDWTTAHALELNETERAFVTSSQDEAQRALHRQQRQNRRLRGLLVGGAVLLVLAVVAGVVATVQRRQARHDASVALARGLGATAVSAPRLDQAMLLARQAVLINRSTATEGTLLSTLLRSPALVGTFSVPIQVRPQVAQVSGDGRWLAVLCSDNVVRFYDARTHHSALRGLGPMIDGNLLIGGAWVGEEYVALTNSDTQTIWTVFDARQGLRQGRRMVESDLFNRGPEGSIAAVVPDPGGRALLFSWNLVNRAGQNTAAYVDRFDLVTGRRTEVALHANGMVGATISRQRRLQVLTQTAEVTLDATTMRIISRRVEHLPPVVAAALSPDGSRAVYLDGSAPSQNSFTGVDLATGRGLSPAGAHDAAVVAVIYTPDGRKVISTADDGTIKIWAADTLALLDTFAGDSGRVLGPVVTADSTTLFSCSLDGAVFEWDLGTARRFGRPFEISTAPASGTVPTPGLALSPTGAQAVAALAGGPAAVLDLRTLRPVASLAAPAAEPVDAVAWSPRGKVATASTGSVQLWNAGSWKTAIATLAVSPGDPTTVAFDPTGRRLAVATHLLANAPNSDGWLDVFDIATGRRIVAQHLHEEAYAAAFSPDGNTLALGVRGMGRTLLIASASGRVQRTLGLPQDFGATAVAWSGNDRVITGDFSGVVAQWDPRTGKRIAHLVLTEGAPVSSLGLDPRTGRFATTGGATGGIRLWDKASLQQYGSDFPGGSSQWGNAQFTPDGQRLVVVYGDGTGYVWPVSEPTLMAHACAVAGRNLTREEWQRFVPGTTYQRTCPQYGAG